MNKGTQKKAAFTLVEIMIVVAIIGLLAAIGIPSFQKARSSSIKKAVANNVEQVNRAVSMIAMDEGLADGNTVTIVALGDCNKDGSLIAADLTCVYTTRSRDAVLTALDTLPGDFDGDGEVAFSDLRVLSENFGQAGGSYTEGNIDLTGGVAFADFLILSDNFGKTPGDVAAVPEPTGCVLVWIGLLGIVVFRRRRSR